MSGGIPSAMQRLEWVHCTQGNIFAPVGALLERCIWPTTHEYSSTTGADRTQQPNSCPLALPLVKYM